MPPKRPSVLSAFLGKITRNLAFDRWKAAHADKRGGGSLPLALDELDECIATKGGVEAAFDEKELSHAIDAFLRTLPERECSIFLRRYWFVDSVRDISERFGINENSVKSILFRTRRAFPWNPPHRNRQRLSKRKPPSPRTKRPWRLSSPKKRPWRRLRAPQRRTPTAL